MILSFTAFTQNGVPAQNDQMFSTHPVQYVFLIITLTLRVSKKPEGKESKKVAAGERKSFFISFHISLSLTSHFNNVCKVYRVSPQHRAN